MNANRGQIITFYSYKSGAGRSLALSNVAWILASNGRRVLVIDWDLEAPALHRFFRPFLDDPTGATTPGLIDLLCDRSLTSVNTGPGGGPASDPASLDVLPYLQSVNWEFSGPGYLDLMTTGRQDPSFGARVNTFEWETFYQRLGGATFFERLRGHLCREYDYVLIDSRTGVADSAGICTVKLPDTLVVCFTLNQQIMDGCAAVARSVVGQRTSEPIRILPVPMRLERAEKDLLDQGLAKAASMFNPLAMPDLSAEARARYWQGVAFYYTPYYSFGELLSVFGDAHRQSDSLLAAAERLTSFLTNGQITSAGPMSEELRRNGLDKYRKLA